MAVDFFSIAAYQYLKFHKPILLTLLRTRTNTTQTWQKSKDTFGGTSQDLPSRRVYAFEFGLSSQKKTFLPNLFIVVIIILLARPYPSMHQGFERSYPQPPSVFAKHWTTVWRMKRPGCPVILEVNIPIPRISLVIRIHT